tara:strand:- start:13485 stop:14126 length:642 start_codon:yes stop_codon:yes gene_type:complete
MAFERTIVERLYFEDAFTLHDVKTYLDVTISQINKHADPTYFNQITSLNADKLLLDVLKMKDEVEKWVKYRQRNTMKDIEMEDTNDTEPMEDINNSKPIILYGVDAVMKKMGLDVRPRLLIVDAAADLDNLSSRLVGQVQWLDGPRKFRKFCTLCESINMVMGTSCNASKFLCINADGVAELIESRRVCNAKGKAIGGIGFHDLAQKPCDIFI